MIIATYIRRTILVCAALLLTVSGLGCADTTTDRELPPSGTRDAGDTGIDATLPAQDVGFSDIRVVDVVATNIFAVDTAAFQDTSHVTDDSSSDAERDDPLPANSIRTCAEFLSCMNDCPPGVGSCVGPCHNAMTTQAASDVRNFLDCASHNSCRKPDCLMQNCGRQWHRCM